MPIQSLQRGTITVGSGNTQQDGTITSVDTTKAFMRRLGGICANNIGGSLIRVQLLNATTVRANRFSTGGGVAGLVNYEVIEFS